MKFTSCHAGMYCTEQVYIIYVAACTVKPVEVCVISSYTFIIVCCCHYVHRYL